MTPSTHAATADSDLLRAFLADRDTPCPGCGYNLRGLVGDLCPECAQRLRIGVGLVEPRLALYLAGLIGLAVGLGFEGIVLIWALSLLALGGSGPSFANLLPLIVGVGFQGASLWIWLRARPRVRRLSLAWRAGLAAAAWTLSALFATWFFATVG